MEKRNIYKMDDVLIVASFLMLIPVVYFSWPWLKTLPRVNDFSAYVLSAPEILGNKLNLVIQYLAGSVLAQVAGRIIRRQEKQALDVLDTILYMRNTTVDQLAVNLAMSRSKVEKTVKKLSRMGSLNITLNGGTVIMESPLPKTSVPKDNAPEPPAADISEPRETESEPLSADRAAIEAKLKDKSLSLQEKFTLLSQLSRSQEGKTSSAGSETLNKTNESLQSMSPEQQKKMKKNAIIMVILFMTPLWPVALIMVVMFVIRQAKSR